MMRFGKIIIAVGVAVSVAGCGPKPEITPKQEVAPVPEEEVLTLGQRIELAQAYMERGRVGDAAEHYQKVLEENPGRFDANLDLGIALMTMEDAKFENERDYSKPAQYFRTAATIRRDDARPHIHLGAIGFKLKNYRDAIDHLSVARNLDPHNESVHEMLGISLIGVGNIEQGKEELRRTLEINPDSPAANFELGRVYERDNKNSPAMRHLERALAGNPNLDMATYLLERIYYEERFYDRAEDKCQQFLTHYPDDIQSLEILGRIYREEGRSEEMLEIYTRLTRIEPDNTTYWSPIIAHHMDSDNYGDAMVVLEESLEQNPYYAYGNIRYGQVLMHYGGERLNSGNRQEALLLFSRAKDHFQKARIDDRYTDTALELIDRAEDRIRSLSKQ